MHPMFKTLGFKTLGLMLAALCGALLLTAASKPASAPPSRYIESVMTVMPAVAQCPKRDRALRAAQTSARRAVCCPGTLPKATAIVMSSWWAPALPELVPPSSCVRRAAIF